MRGGGDGQFVAISVGFLLLARAGLHVSTHVALVVTVAATTACWVVTAFVGPETDRDTLIAFYRRVRPFGPGWACIREAAGLPADEMRSSGDNIPLALIGWVSGCTAVWSSLFAVGNFLYGRIGAAVALLAVFLLSGFVLLRVVQRLWRIGRLLAPRCRSAGIAQMTGRHDALTGAANRRFPRRHDDCRHGPADGLRSAPVGSRRHQPTRREPASSVATAMPCRALPVITNRCQMAWPCRKRLLA